jgi:hypothetical protein
MVGSKTLWSYYTTCGESVQPLQSVKTNRLAVLTVKSGMDPHMINILKDGLKSLSLVACHILMVHLTFMLNVGWYKLILY